MVFMKTILNIKTDKDLKEEAKAVAQELGVPLSTVVNAFLKQFVRDREVVFSAGYTPSKYLVGILDSFEEERKNKTLETFDSLDALFDDLDN